MRPPVRAVHRDQETEEEKEPFIILLIFLHRSIIYLSIDSISIYMRLEDGGIRTSRKIVVPTHP